MSTLERYKKVFIEALSISPDTFTEEIKYNDVAEWDSIGHMTLISGLEEGFEITIETDDIVDFSSFNKGKDILKKYKINF